MLSVDQIKIMISKMMEHVAALQKKAQDDDKYYNGAVDSLVVLTQEIDKLEKENQKSERKVSKVSGPSGEEKVRAIRSSSRNQGAGKKGRNN